MGLPGREPNPDSINRNKPAADWTDVEDKPFTGKPPVSLPAERTYETPDGPATIALTAMTKDWWKVHSTMPHCILWTEADWIFARDTALLVDMLYAGKHTVATEIRTRLKTMGATHDARVSMRIRYVPAAKNAPAPKTKGKTGTATVTSINERRLRQRHRE